MPGEVCLPPSSNIPICRYDSPDERTSPPRSADTLTTTPSHRRTPQKSRKKLPQNVPHTAHSLASSIALLSVPDDGPQNQKRRRHNNINTLLEDIHAYGKNHLTRRESVVKTTPKQTPRKVSITPQNTSQIAHVIQSYLYM